MNSLDNQFLYWDKVSSSKTFTHPLDVKQFQGLIPQDSAILDYGCGYGRTCNDLHHLGYTNITGVDSSEKMIERGWKEYSTISLRHLQEEQLFSKPSRFDVILLFAVLTCIPSDQGQRELIKKLSQLLRPNGILYVSDYWLQDNERNFNRYKEYEGKYNRYGVFELPEGAIVRHHSKEWIQTLFQDFKIIDLSDCELSSMNGNQSSCFQFFGCKKSKTIS